MHMNDDKISSSTAYQNIFNLNSRKEALQIAIQNRKFEIELYWKRATYFWTLIAAVFVGYFASQGKGSTSFNFAPFIISCIGLLFSLAWHIVSRASAYWHANWDAHVHQLENEFIGPLHKMTIDKNAFRLRDIEYPYRFSGTKIHSLTSLYIIFIWFFLLIKSLFAFSKWADPCSYFIIVCVFFTTAIFIFLLLRKTKPGKLIKANAFVIEKKILNE